MSTTLDYHHNHVACPTMDVAVSMIVLCACIKGGNQLILFRSNSRRA